MNAVRKSAPQPSLRTALVVSASEGHARVDRISLKNAKIVVSRAVKSAKAAREHLKNLGADVVLVDEHLEDGPGWDFMRSLRTDPATRDIPVIMISSSADKKKVLAAVKLGCVGYLVRPYTLDTFFKHLALAGRSKSFLAMERKGVAEGLDLVDEGRVDQALPLLEEVSLKPEEAQRLYENGMRHLAMGMHSQAVEAFNSAVRVNAMMAEAHIGLARCYLALGDEVRYRTALTRAADICAKASRFERYKNEFVDILQADPGRFNPFLSLGMRLSQGMDWNGALMAYKNAVWLDPTDAKVHLELAKAYHFKREPELAMNSVSQALKLSQDDEAHALYERWTGRPWGSSGEEEEEDGEAELPKRGQVIPDMIPAVLNGVLYLAGVVTEGIHRFRRDYA